MRFAAVILLVWFTGCDARSPQVAEPKPQTTADPDRLIVPLADTEPVREAPPSRRVKVWVGRCVDLAGESHEPMKIASPARVFVFLSMSCPISRAALDELKKTARQFPRATFFGVVSDPGLSRKEAREQFSRTAIPFPILYDQDGAIREQLDATHVPQAVAINAQGEICYSGRIDNRFADIGKKSTAPLKRDLAFAIGDLLGGRIPEVTETKPVGCLLEPFEKPIATTGEITFASPIAGIVHRRCVSCHRPGEATPFSMLSYDEVTKRAKQILHVVERGIMPPWKPAKNFGHFADERKMPASEIALLKKWIDAGMPEGDSRLTPVPPKFTRGWKLGKPDLVLEVRADFEIPAGGKDIYRHFVLPSGLTENRLVAAMEFRPGNPKVVHHSFVYFDTSGRARQLDKADPGPGYTRFGGVGFLPNGGLGGWGPGGRPRQLPAGMGRPMPKGCDVVLQIHYHPIGSPQKDRSRIGIYFANAKSTRWVTELMVSNVDLKIPAGAKRHIHRASYTLPVETTVLDITPHMHERGVAVKAMAVLPNGNREPLLWIKEWNFFWQTSYTFSFPIRLPAGTRIEAEFVFENEHGQAPVRWGENSTDEMAILYLQATTDTLGDYGALVRDVSKYYRKLSLRDKENQKRARSSRPNAKQNGQ